MNLENFARNNSKGLWSNKKPTEPWVFRKIEKNNFYYIFFFVKLDYEN